jgi:hypothetical protein
MIVNNSEHLNKIQFATAILKRTKTNDYKSSNCLKSCEIKKKGSDKFTHISFLGGGVTIFHYDAIVI